MATSLMENGNSALNAHEAPPIELKEIFKKYQKLDFANIDTDVNIVDFSRLSLPSGVEALESMSPSQLGPIFHRFAPGDEPSSVKLDDIPVYRLKALPGLLILPSLLPPHVQKALLSRLLHRDLCDPRHKTNLHLHYNVPYPKPKDSGDADLESTTNKTPSFFSYPPSSNLMFYPKDGTLHRPLSIAKVMQKNLRWITLGGQYDWTQKEYPDEKPPAFPPDIRCLLEETFTEMKAQAAIVNLYSPGDKLSLHRDVSEQSNQALVSISLGCECLFVIGLGQASNTVVVRLRSGDGLVMAKDARFAWHGVPKVLPASCPSYLGSWPAESGRYEDWRGWMSNKRINLNVRQMYG